MSGAVDHFYNGSLDYSQIHVPEELVAFFSQSSKNVLLLNPEIGSFTKISFEDFELLKTALEGNAPGSTPDSAKPIVARLIIERVIYYGSFRPVLDDIAPPVPSSVYWETTHGCSLRCVYCYMSADTVRPGELSTDEARNLISQISELGSQRFIFTGGEAMIRKDLFELGEHASERGLTTELITNATLVTSIDVARKVKDTFDYVTVSLDGSCPEHNDLHRGVGSFNLIVRGMKLLNEVGVVFNVNSAISPQNITGLDNLYDYLVSDFNINQHRVTTIGRIGRGKSVHETDKWSIYKEMFDIAKERVKEGTTTTVGDMMVKDLKKDFRPKMNCGMGSGEIYIDSQGHVFPCKLVTEDSWYSGDIRESPLSEILKSQVMSKARDHSVMDTVGCRTCIIRRLCGGGCRGNHLGVSGEAFTNDPNTCWTLRHGMITDLWLSEDVASALDEEEAWIPRLFKDDEVWQPELGTSLPDSILRHIESHKNSLKHNELPMI